MLQELFDLLIHNDPNFQEYWKFRSLASQKKFLTLGREIESIDLKDRYSLKYINYVHNKLSQYMVRIQDAPFDYSRIPVDWIDVVRDKEAKLELYKTAKSKIDRFFQSHCTDERVELYGGIKSEESLTRKLTRPKQTNDQFRTMLLDTWDVVRFRIVAPNISVLRDIALNMWEQHYLRVLRCRNYYFHPKDHNQMNPYRAIHFELEIYSGRIIEVQLMTKSRELVCLLDHAPMFKKSLGVFTLSQLEWLTNISLKSNVYEYHETFGKN